MIQLHNVTDLRQRLITLSLQLYLVWGSHRWWFSSVVAAHVGEGMVHDRVAGAPRCSCVRCCGAPCHWKKEKLVAVKLQEHAALLLPWNGVALGFNESGAGWRWVAMLLCEKKGHGAGVGVRRRCWVEVCYCCWALLVLHGRKNLHFTVEKARKTVLGVWKEEMRGL